ncbi:MAG TPA: caspase family protein, partial [Kofleriaceae bacterium]
MLGARYKALLIGASEFAADPENLLPLHGPAHDLRAMRAALSSSSTGLTADADIIDLLDPTKARAELAIHEFFTAGQRGDVLVFYFSG